MKILTLALLLLCSLALAAEEKPKYTWEYHLITSLPPNVERKDSILPFRSEGSCRTFLQRIALVLAGSREEVPGFSWVGVCATVQSHE